jgi:hypothetical protein
MVLPFILSGCNVLGVNKSPNNTATVIVKNSTIGTLPIGYKSQPMIKESIGNRQFFGVFRPQHGGNSNTLLAAIYEGATIPYILSAQAIPSTGYLEGEPKLYIYHFNNFSMMAVLCALGGFGPSNPYSAAVFINSDGSVIPAGTYSFGAFSGMKKIDKYIAKALLPNINEANSMQGIVFNHGTSTTILRFNPKNNLIMNDQITNPSQIISIAEDATPYIEVNFSTTQDGSDPMAISDIQGAYINQTNDPNTGLSTITVKSGTSVAINTGTIANPTIFDDIYSSGIISNVVGNTGVGQMSQDQFIPLAAVQTSPITAPLKPGEYRFLVASQDSTFIQFVVHVQ